MTHRKLESPPSALRPWPAHSRAATFAFLLVAASGDLALAQSQRCEVVISIDNAITANAIQIEVDHGAAQAGGFSKFDCTATAAPPALTTVNVDGDTVEIAWVDQAHVFAGPSVFASCQFFPSMPPAVLDAADFVPTVKDCSLGNPPIPCSPSVSVAIGGCTEVAPVCGNFAPEIGEPCDEGPSGGPTCTGQCTPKAACSDFPLPDCRTGSAGKSKIQLKNNTKDVSDNAKDQGRYDWKGGAATELAELGDPLSETGSYHWCVYDDGKLVLGAEIPGGGTCAGKPCWKAAGSGGFQYRDKPGSAHGVAQLKLKAGSEGKASIGVKAKSKAGSFAAPASMPLAGPVKSQFVVENGVEFVCFESDFTAPSKNEAKQYSAKGP